MLFLSQFPIDWKVLNIFQVFFPFFHLPLFLSFSLSLSPFTHILIDKTFLQMKQKIQTFI